MRKIIILFGTILLATATVFGQGDYLLEYANLYPDCIDNEESTIYGGSYGEYPSGIQDAIFPGGGDVQMSRYIARTIEYPEVYSGEVDEKGKSLLVTGIVKVQFVVDRCGRVGRIEIVQSLSEEQDAEAKRIIENFPIFKPATLDGYRVKIAYVAPVSFNKKKIVKKAPEIDYDSYQYW